MSETCKRLGCDHGADRHEERTTRGLAKMASGPCEWRDFTTRPCADCTCSNFSAKVVDRRGLGPQYPRHDPSARTAPRITPSPDTSTDREEK